MRTDDAKDAGFTLLEVLVSMMVLALSYAVLMHTISAALLQTRTAKTLVQASEIAKRLQAELAQHKDVPASGLDQSTGLTWLLETQPIAQSMQGLKVTTIHIRPTDKGVDVISLRTIMASRSSSP